MIVGEISDKQPSETFPVTLNFKNHLAPGETITGADVTAKNMDTGADSTSEILIGAVAIATPNVGVRVRAGQSGSWHRIQWRVTTDGANLYEAEVELKVAEI